MKLCEIPGCGRQYRGRGMCNGHYVRWQTGFRGEKLLKPFGEIVKGLPDEVIRAIKDHESKEKE
jgi:hypothetical protein